MKRLVAALGVFAFVSVAHAELKPLSDESLQAISGQSGVIMDVSGQITYEAIYYNGERIDVDNPISSDGLVSQSPVYMDGYTVGIPAGTGTIMDLFALLLPLTYGEVDTDGDGIMDRGAAVFNFKPNLLGTSFTPISIRPEDTTINMNDQVFVTKQGIVFLNAPLPSFDGEGIRQPDYIIDGQAYQYNHPQKLF